MKEARDNLFKQITLTNKCDINIFKSFLGEIYTSVTKRTKKEMDLFLFNEILSLPLFITEKIYKVFTNNSLIISKNNFIDGLSLLFYGNKNEQIELLFQILDYTSLTKINHDDTKLFFIYLHSIYHTNRTQKYLTDIIDSFFEIEKKIDLNDFKWKCNNLNYDLVMLFSFFIHNSKFFSNEQLEYFADIKKKDSSGEKKNEMDNFNFLHLSKKLLDYVSIPITPPSHTSSTKEINSIPEEDEKELNELQDFESELAETMSNLDQISINRHKRAIEEEEDDDEEDEYANLGVRKNSNFTKEKFSSFFQSTESKQRAFSFFGSKPKKLKSFYESNPKNDLGIVLKSNELLCYSINHNNSLLLVKLVLIHNVIFLFTYNNDFNKFTFLKIIFLNSTYPVHRNKIQIDEKFYFGLHLISTFHNSKASMSFYSQNEEEINNFKKLIETALEIRNIEDDYSLSTEVGRGKFGVVKLAVAKKNEKRVAVKIIRKFDKATTEEDYKIFQWEKSIFQFLKHNSHPNIVKAIDLYENEESIYFITEYIQGGDLKTFVKNGKMDSQNLVSFSFQIINGIYFLHNHGIMHRDIKHTNILVSRSKNGDNIIKIIDFGLSKVIGKNETDNSPYGSLSFKAPEIIKGENYNFKVDVWSAGVTIFFITFHEVPFNDKNRQQLKEHIVSDNFTFPSFKERLKGNYDYSFVYSLITDCLVKDPNIRFDSKKLMKKYFENFATSVD